MRQTLKIIPTLTFYDYDSLIKTSQLLISMGKNKLSCHIVISTHLSIIIQSLIIFLVRHSYLISFYSVSTPQIYQGQIWLPKTTLPTGSAPSQLSILVFVLFFRCQDSSPLSHLLCVLWSCFLVIMFYITLTLCSITFTHGLGDFIWLSSYVHIMFYWIDDVDGGCSGGL